MAARWMAAILAAILIASSPAAADPPPGNPPPAEDSAFDDLLRWLGLSRERVGPARDPATPPPDYRLGDDWSFALVSADTLDGRLEPFDARRLPAQIAALQGNAGGGGSGLCPAGPPIAFADPFPLGGGDTDISFMLIGGQIVVLPDVAPGPDTIFRLIPGAGGPDLAAGPNWSVASPPDGPVLTPLIVTASPNDAPAFAICVAATFTFDPFNVFINAGEARCIAGC